MKSDIEGQWVFWSVLIVLLLMVVIFACDAVIYSVNTEQETTPTTEATVTTPTTVETVPTEIVEPTTEPTVEVESTEPQYTIVINEDEAIALAKMAWGEARGCSDMEIAATMWSVLNRVDSWGDTIVGAITMPRQYHGYRPSNPVDERIYNLSVDVLTRWQMEKQGASPEEVGRVLPPEYIYFYGDGVRNYFKDNYEYAKANIWDWSYPNPYETEES